MRVSDLLRAGLGLRLVLGGNEGLARPVTGTSTVDLQHPGRYVGVGHLVLTGLVWRTGAGDSEVFVAQAAAAGASILGVGEGLLGSVPDDVVAAAQRHRLPVLAVPADVAFHAVSDHVAAAVGSPAGGAARLLEGLAAGRPLDVLLADVARELRRGIRVLTTTGAATVAGSTLPEADVAAVVAAGAGAVGGGTVALTGGTVHVRGAGSADPLACWWLVVDEPGADGPGVDGGGAAGDPRRDDLLEAAAGAVAVARRWGRPAPGAPAARPVRAVCAQLHPAAAAPETLPDLLADALGVAARTDPGTGTAVALVPAPGPGRAGTPDPVAPLADRLRRLSPALTRRRLVVGVGRPDVDPGVAVGSAHRALARAEDGTGLVVVHDTAPRSALDLLRSVPAPVRAEFVAEVLGPLGGDEDLLRTLRTYLSTSNSPTRAAAELHVHQNTVRYRIGRVEVLLHRDLRDVDDVVDLQVALRLRG